MFFTDKYHGRFTYPKIWEQYIDIKTNIEMWCTKHELVFWQSFGNHSVKIGCWFCSGVRLHIDDFIERSKAIHNDKYTYDRLQFDTIRDKTKITCPDHGEFLQAAYIHMKGHGCPQCANTNTSGIEHKWLDSLNVPKELRQAAFKVNGKLVKADAYDPRTNTIYEFYGDYWHGNPAIFKADRHNKNNGERFGDLYKATIDRETFLKQAGYILGTIWEKDFRALLKQQKKAS